MKQTSFLMVVILAIAAMVTPVQGTSSVIGFQARADAGGQGIAGIHELTVTIYDAATGNNVVWGPQKLSDVTLKDGDFSVLLGPEDTDGRRLDVALQEKGEGFIEFTLSGIPKKMPRQKLSSVPYALSSSNGIPPGTILPYSAPGLGKNSMPPEGFVWCDGSQLNVDNYPNLAAVLLGENSKKKTFRVPDFNNRFLLGVDKNGTYDDTYMRNRLGVGGGDGGFTLAARHLPKGHTHNVKDRVRDLQRIKTGHLGNKVKMPYKNLESSSNPVTTSCDGCVGEPVTFIPPFLMMRYMIKY